MGLKTAIWLVGFHGILPKGGVSQSSSSSNSTAKMASWSTSWHVSNPGCFLFQIAMLQGQESRSWPHAHFIFSPNGFTWMSSKIAADVSSKWQRWDSRKWAVWNLVSSRLSINYRLSFVREHDVMHFHSLKFVQHQLSGCHWVKLTTLTVWLVFFLLRTYLNKFQYWQ